MGITITKPIYKGKELTDFLTKVFFKKNSIDRVTILPNVKDKFGMNFLNFSGLVLGPAGCDFSPNVNAELTDKQLVITTYDINFEECIITFEQSYLADTLRAGSNNTALPPSFDAWLMDKLPAKIAAELERKFFSEIEAELLVDGGIINTDILPMTALNAIDEIGKVYLDIPEELEGDPDLVIWVNSRAWKFYKLAAIDTQVPELLTDGIKMTYLGIEMIMAPQFNAGKGGGLANDTIIAGLLPNFVRAADLLSDDSELSVIDLRKTTGDKKIRIVGSLKFKASYGTPSEIVLGNPV